MRRSSDLADLKPITWEMMRASTFSLNMSELTISEAKTPAERTCGMDASHGIQADGENHRVTHQGSGRHRE